MIQNKIVERIKHITRNSLRLSAFISFFVISVLAFNNCGPSFKVAEPWNEQLRDVSSVDAPNALNGKALYAAHCAACHGPDETSTKRNRSAAEIDGALRSIPQMSYLQLSLAEVDAIADSISDTPTTTIPTTTTTLPPGVTTTTTMFGAPPTTTTTTTIPVATGPQKVFSCTDTNKFGKTPLLRLTRTQYINVLTRIFGGNIVNQLSGELADLQTDLQMFRTPSEFNLQYSQLQIDIFRRIAVKVASLVPNDTTVLNALGGSCLAQSNPNASCITNFVSSFGLKAFRRPLTTDDFNDANSILNSVTDSKQKISSIVEWMLQSPSFLYRLELGTAGNGDVNSPRQLTTYEIASRLSFFIQDNMPDATLLTLAADPNQLKTLSVVKQQVDRLFAEPAAQAKLAQFVRYWLKLDYISEVPTAPAPFLNGLNTSGLKTEMVREIQEYVQHVVFAKQGNYRELMTSDDSFARTPALAQIYGHATVTSSAPQKMNARRGLLLRSPVLASGSYVTSPVLRGVKIQTRVLCQDIPAPAGDTVSMGIAITTAHLTTMSNRDRTALNTSPTTCLSCHRNINPTGFIFENYDSLGRYRSQEVLYNANNSVLAQHSINAAASVPVGSSSWNVANEMDFINQLADSKEGAACMVRQVYRFYQMQQEVADDACRLSEMEDALAGANGNILESLKKFVVNRYVGLRRFQ